MVGLEAGVSLTAAAGGSQTIRFERFTFQASSSAGGIDFHRADGPYHWANARLVRYADDFVILAKYVGGRIEQFVAQTLQDWMELKVNPSAKSEDSASTSPT